MSIEKQSKGVSIAVVGGGIIGLCSALKLQLEGHQVTVFDPSGAGSKCSKGNAGHFATEQILPLSNPGLIPQLPKMLLSPKSPVSIRFRDLPNTAGWMFRFLAKAREKPTNHATSALTELNSRAMSSWNKLLEDVELSHLIKSEGSLLVFESEQLFESYQATLEKMKSHGVRWEIWEGNLLRSRMPNLADTVKCGVFFPDTSHTTDPYYMCLELKSSFIYWGGKWQQDKVENVKSDQVGSVVVTDKSAHHFDKVVMATGAQSVPIIKKVTNIKVPLQAERGYHLMVNTPHELLPIPVSSADRKFIMTPMKHGLRLAGTVEYASIKSPANMQRANMLKNLAKGVLKQPVLEGDLGSKWMGNRPSLPDSLPIIDQNEKGNILFAFGHQHLGLTQAAITADLVSDMVNGKQTTLDLSPYRLTRFG
ncbi:FAD-binding oxidoreductase [Vibrio sp. T187]|uniref:NAD(P)/FAD-dependent oxidoreductase n=1 Tax=Vibrio TaxID=662 RepID=UPI0010C948D8|nr:MULTISPECIES: FAD-binding oxidoreductase [Vibrio]MBW3695005.1 FAD-binding oxidoreductase [Vibrio sp. T187]